MVSPVSLIVTHLGEGIFIEVCLKESSPSALEDKSVFFIAENSFSAVYLFPYKTRRSVINAQSPTTLENGLMLGQHWNYRLSLLRSPDLPVTPTLSLIFQFSSKSKHQKDIFFLLMSNPAAPVEGGRAAEENPKIEVFS